MLRMIDTFSGIGGFSLAARWLGGIETVQFVEREPYCQRILRKHWPDVPIHDDICTYEPERGSADVVVGGFPCQDISHAGKGAGLAGERSGLFYELLRIVRLVGPRYVVLENVAAITYRGMDAVLGALAEAGYDAEWACIPAAAVGACHQRDRWWCVAYANHARVEAQGAKQQPAGTEQHRELDASGFAADATGKQRNDLRAARSGRQAKSESGNGDRADAADAIGRTAQLRRSAGELAGQTGATESQGHQRQRGRYAIGNSSATPYSMRQRLEGPDELESSGAPWPSAIARLSPDWRSYLSEPVLRRGDDGLSGRVDRLKALGNAVVPQVAMVPLARVLELDRQLEVTP